MKIPNLSTVEVSVSAWMLKQLIIVTVVFLGSAVWSRYLTGQKQCLFDIMCIRLVDQ
jgi:hypothetical protein